MKKAGFILLLLFISGFWVFSQEVILDLSSVYQNPFPCSDAEVIPDPIGTQISTNKYSYAPGTTVCLIIETNTSPACGTYYSILQEIVVNEIPGTDICFDMNEDSIVVVNFRCYESTRCPSPPPTPAPTPGSEAGDVNADGTVDIIDALLVAQYYVGLIQTFAEPAAADVNCDNSIDIVDALLISQYYVGLISIFPCDAP